MDVEIFQFIDDGLLDTLHRGGDAESFLVIPVDDGGLIGIDADHMAAVFFGRQGNRSIDASPAGEDDFGPVDLIPVIDVFMDFAVAEELPPIDILEFDFRLFFLGGLVHALDVAIAKPDDRGSGHAT